MLILKVSWKLPATDGIANLLINILKLMSVHYSTFGTYVVYNYFKILVEFQIFPPKKKKLGLLNYEQRNR